MSLATLTAPTGRWRPSEGVRDDLIDEVREEIDAQRYVSMKKVEVTVELLFVKLVTSAKGEEGSRTRIGDDSRRRASGPVAG